MKLEKIILFSMSWTSLVSNLYNLIVIISLLKTQNTYMYFCNQSEFLAVIPSSTLTCSCRVHLLQDDFSSLRQDPVQNALPWVGGELALSIHPDQNGKPAVNAPTIFFCFPSQTSWRIVSAGALENIISDFLEIMLKNLNTELYLSYLYRWLQDLSRI